MCNNVSMFCRWFNTRNSVRVAGRTPLGLFYIFVVLRGYNTFSHTHLSAKSGQCETWCSTGGTMSIGDMPVYDVWCDEMSKYYRDNNNYNNYTHYYIIYVMATIVPSNMDKPSIMRILAFSISSSSTGMLPFDTPKSIVSCLFTHRPSSIFKPCTNFRRPCLNSGT